MIERIVENWLTNANERSFQIPFCQLLSAEGEKLVYIASHGPFEKGKDVITELPDGTVRAYQMKGGDIKLAQWREIGPQINNLVELPIQLSSLRSQSWHEPFLVTNGRIEDTVLDYINTANLGWSRRTFPHPLRTLEKSALVRKFTDLHGAFLPQEERDFQALLALVLRDGRAPLDKPSFARFLETTLRLDTSLRKSDLSRAFASCLLLTSYVLGSSVAAGNTWAQFEAWTMVCSYIAALATRDSLEDSYWRQSFELALLSARQALTDLTEECRTREDYIEGDPLTDGHVYGARQTLLLGLVSARALNTDHDPEMVRFALNFHAQAVRHTNFFGESCTPHLSLAAMFLSSRCQSEWAEELMLQVLEVVGRANSRGGRGVPDPFASTEESLRFQHRLKAEDDTEDYSGSSYTAELTVDFLARRWRRQGLALRWKALTRISLLTSIPAEAWEWFRWRADKVALESRFYPEPQSWSQLLQHAEERSTAVVPAILRHNREFLCYYLLVYPHRLNVHTQRQLEKAFS